MSQFSLVGFQHKHNTIVLAKGLGWLVLAGVTWVVSYGLAWGLFAIPLWLWGSIWNWSPSWTMCRYAAWIGVALLAIEGIRYSKKLFDTEAYARSLYYRIYTLGFDKPPLVVSPLLGNPLAAPYIVTQILLIAPRATVRTVAAFRSLVFMNSETARHAAAIVAELLRSRFWTPAVSFKEHAAALYPLHKMKILWQKLENDELQIKLDPEFANLLEGRTFLA